MTSKKNIFVLHVPIGPTYLVKPRQKIFFDEVPAQNKF